MKGVKFMGDTKAILKSYVQPVRNALGRGLQLVQMGKQPKNSKPLFDGVFEIKVKDPSGAFRLAYILVVKEKVHVLHVFQKKSQKTHPRDLATIRARAKEARREEG